MKKIMTDASGVISVRAHPEDAVARVRSQVNTLRQRVKQSQPVLTNAERDLLLLAVAQKLGII